MSFRAHIPGAPHPDDGAPGTGHGARGAGLGRRLQAVAAMVPAGTRVADLGTQHGGLPRHLLSTGRATFCLATEVHRSRLELPAGVDRNGPEPEFRIGDGLDPIEPGDRIDVVTITGLGARAIRRILDGEKRQKLGIRRFLLQPQTEWRCLRGWALDSGMRVVEEAMVEERGRFYLVLALEPPGSGFVEPAGSTGVRIEPEDDRELWLEAGPCLLRTGNPVVRRYWERRLRREEGFVRDVDNAEARAAARGRAELARKALAVIGARR